MVQYLIFVYNRGEHGFPYIGGVRGEHGFPCYFPSVLYTGALDLASSADRCAFF